MTEVEQRLDVLETQMEALLGDPADLESAAATGRYLKLRANQMALVAGQSEIKADLSNFKTSVGEQFDKLRTDMGELRTDMGELRTDMGELRTDMGAMNAALVAGLRQLGVILPSTSAEQLRLLDDEPG